MSAAVAPYLLALMWANGWFSANWTGIEKARAEIGRSTAVDHRRAHDVRPTLECQAFGNAIVDHCLPIAVDANDLLPVHPPHRRRVGADRQTHARHFLWRIDDGDHPEQHVRRRLAKA